MSDGVFKVEDVPKAHAEFEQVVVVGYPQTGVCTIRGLGKTIENDGAGTLVRGRVDSLADALMTKYGKPEKTDGCFGGDVACEEQFWMMTLNDNERAYAYRWAGGDALKAAKLKNLVLAAQALNISTSWVVIEYNGDNDKACEAAANAANAEAL